MGKRRRPCPINRHASTEAAGFWGPRRSALDLWLRLEAKPERALGPGLLSAFWKWGSPDLPACGPRRGYASRPVRPIFIDKAYKTLARGQASRGSCDVSHDDRHQAGASARSVFVSSLVLRKQAQARSTEASGKGFSYRCNKTKDQQDDRTEVIVEPKTASLPTPLTGGDHL